MKRYVKDSLIKLGWVRWDGDLWKCGDIIMPWMDAAALELENYSWIKTITSSCPECKRRTTFGEFIGRAVK